MNKSKEHKIKNNLSSNLKQDQKDFNKEKLQEYNGFNIIELNEDQLIEENDLDMKNLAHREIARLIKKSHTIEDHYNLKDENEKINENCFNCLLSDFRPNELLYFPNRKDLLSYLKYCFIFLKKIIFIEHSNFIDNKYDLSKCDNNFLNGWKFFIPKTMCKSCFLQIVNMKHLFGNLKTIFCDVDQNLLSKSFHNSYSNSSFYRNKSTRRTHGTHPNQYTNRNNNRRGNDNIIKIKLNNKKIRNKDNPNISFNEKNGEITVNKKILDNEILNKIPNKKGKINKKKFINRKRRFSTLKKNKNRLNEDNATKELSEIKIHSNEYINEESEINKGKNDSKKEEKNGGMEEKDKNKNNNSIIKVNTNNKNNINGNNQINEIIINNNYMTNNLNPNNFISEIDLNNKINNGIENQNDETKAQKILNIYSEILNSSTKPISNKIVMLFQHKLDILKDLLLYTTVNIGDFKEKLLNSITYNPEIICMGVIEHENYFHRLYNKGIVIKKSYEMLYNKLINESIPGIYKNIIEMKNKNETMDDDKKLLDELFNNLKNFEINTAEIERVFDDTLSNFFENFNCLFSILNEIKITFTNPCVAGINNRSYV